jgi:LysM repeat protein
MMKVLNCLVLFLLFAFNVQAQQFKTHAVKSGETLYSISKLYRVTPFNILKYNKEIKQGDVLKPNTILVIPMQASASDTSPLSETPKEVKTVKQEQDQRIPLRFRNHRVRKKETIYGISRRYEVSVDEIKRYNKELYSAPLKKGMRLQIPVFPEIEEVTDSINSEDFETYVVLPKETRWSIAHKYGITIDSLVSLNPSLPKSTNHLAIGQELILPKKPGSTVEGQEVQLFESYTVPSKKTMYSLSGEYGITSDEIIKLNPKILEQGGLKEGMVLRLPVKKLETEEVNTDNYIFYEVKPKQTEYSLTRKLGIGYSDLLALNPELSRGLKAGMVLKLPKENAVNLEVRNSLILDKINLLDSINRGNKPRLLVLLPFRINRLDLDSIANTEQAIERSNAISYSLGLYSGALMAIDSIAKLGVSVDVKTFDTELSKERVRLILARQNMGEFDAIIGPLQPENLKEVASQANQYQIPIIAPLTSESDLSLPNVFFSVPSDKVLRTRMLDYVEAVKTEQNIIVISDSKNDSTRALIQQRFPLAKSIQILEDEKNISLNIEKFRLLLSLEKENWVFVEIDNFKLVASVTSILNSANTQETPVRMFTTNKNKAFENDVVSGTHLSNLNFTYPSIYKESGNDSFVRNYRNRYGSNPDRYATRGFDLTYDLLLKLAYRPNLLAVSDRIGITEYSGNKFDYAKDLSSGYFNMASYIMMYQNMSIKQITP